MQFELSILPIVYPFTEVALPSGSSGSNTMQVQLLLSAPSLKAFVYAALSVFLSRFSTEMTDINKADSKRIRLIVNSWG